ncbi:MAG: hypothetical protein IKX20_12555 [Paludibacteraceae bacterium]|nr:hypothetical protein [Paludibacteraceae bacterium]
MKRSLFMAFAALLLCMPLLAQEEEYRYSDMMVKDLMYVGGSFNLEGVKAARTPQTIEEAVAALPEIPAVETVMSLEAKEKAIRATYQPYKMALEQTMRRVQNKDAEIRARMDAAHQKQAQRGQQAMQQYQSNVNAGLMPSQDEMMALYMSGKITENMSDEQMMDVMAGEFAKKWGISKEEYLKIMGMANSNPKQAEAYIKSNHPDLYKRLYAANAGYNTQEVADDPRDKRFGEIGEALTKALEELEAVTDEYTKIQVNNGSVVRGKFDAFFEQLYTEWPKSSESHQIDAIEAALEKRVEAWYQTLPPSNTETPFPAWWTAERKKENALIDQWNRRGAEKWLARARDYQGKYKAVFEKVAALEAENEALNNQGAPENLIYLQNLHQINVFYGLLFDLSVPMQDAFGFPCIEHVETDGAAHLGKG